MGTLKHLFVLLYIIFCSNLAFSQHSTIDGLKKSISELPEGVKKINILLKTSDSLLHFYTNNIYHSSNKLLWLSKNLSYNSGITKSDLCCAAGYFEKRDYINLKQCFLKALKTTTINNINIVDNIIVRNVALLYFGNSRWNETIEFAQNEQQYKIDEKQEQAVNNFNYKNGIQKQKLKTQKLIYLCCIIGLLVAILFILILFKDLRRKRKDNKILTKQKQEIEDLNKNLVLLNNAKDKVFSVIGHDLNTSFASIYELSELIQPESKIITTEEKREFCKDLLIVSKESYQLLTNLMYWSKLQLKEFKPEYVSFELNKIIDGIFNVFHYKSKIKAIKLNYNKSCNILVKADKVAIELVLLNLVSNAIKFTNKNGEINIYCAKEDNKIVIKVCDTGIGLSLEKSKEIFDFSQHNTAYGTDNEKGTGLGLIICKELIEINKGKIYFESNTGKGSCFYFSIPFITE